MSTDVRSPIAAPGPPDDRPPGPRRVGTPLAAVRRALIRLGGGSSRTTDGRRRTALGLWVLVVGLLAVLSTTLFLTTFVRVSPVGAVLGGLVAGLLVGLVDVVLLSTPIRRADLRRTLGLYVLLRSGAALIIAGLLCTAGAVQAFAGDIAVEVDRLRAEEFAADPRFAEIPKLEAERAALVTATRSPMDDPEVRFLKEEADRRRAELRDAQLAVEAELEGLSRSGRPGPGPATAEKERRRDDARRAADNAEAAFTTAFDTVRGEIDAFTTRTRDGIDARLDELRAERERAEAQIVGQAAGAGPRRMEAIARLAAAQPISTAVGVVAFLLAATLLLPPALAATAGGGSGEECRCPDHCAGRRRDGGPAPGAF